MACSCKAELVALQESYDDFMRSSRELEEELEKELTQGQEQISSLSSENAGLTTKLEDHQSKLSACSSEASALHAELGRWKVTFRECESEKCRLEQVNDELEEKHRIVEATGEALRHQLDCAIEEKIFVENDLEDLLARQEENERRLKEEIGELRQELAALTASHNGGRCAEVTENSKQDALAHVTYDGGLLSPRGCPVGAEELIRGLEEEVQVLSEKLKQQKSSNVMGEQESSSARLDSLQRNEMLEKAECEIAAAQARIVLLEEELAEITGINEEMEHACADATEEIMEKAVQIRELEKMVQEKDKQLRELRERLDQQRTEVERTAGRLEAKIRDLTTEAKEKAIYIAELESNGAEFQERFDTIEAAVQQAKDDLEEEVAYRIEVVEESTERGHQLVKLTDEVHSLQTEVFTLRRQLQVVTENQLQGQGTGEASPLGPELFGTNELQQRISQLEYELQLEKARFQQQMAPPNRLSMTPLLTRVGEPPADPVDQPLVGSTLVQDLCDMDVSFSGAKEKMYEHNDIDELLHDLTRLKSDLEVQRSVNVNLLAKLQALKGNIEVICRIRPPSAKELAADYSITLEALSEHEVGVWDKRNKEWKGFVMDRVLGIDAQQEDVYMELEPLSLSVADGYNACILAFGQTGSGKTHTMIGEPKDGKHGVTYWVLRKLFDVLSLRASRSAKLTGAGGVGFLCSVRVGMLEIYNEEVRDLLGSPLSTGKLDIRKGSDGLMEVPGMTYIDVKKLRDVIEVLNRGISNRAVAMTSIHDHSSRSHSVLQVEVATQSGSSGIPTKGRLSLVDLAGSERIKQSGVTGAQLKEATHINSSLSALGDVMQALDNKAPHIPYRNSRLTYLLQDTIGGNSRTAMIFTVCPTENTLEESIFTLQFATRVRSISLAPAQRNLNTKNLQENVKELKVQLRDAAREKELAEGSLASLQREHARSQQKLGSMLNARTKNVEELKREMENDKETLKVQLEEMQAALLHEKQQRTALQVDYDGITKRLKRMEFKSEMLEKMKEDGKARLAVKDQEVIELKVELRRARSDAYQGKRFSVTSLTDSRSLAVKRKLSSAALPTTEKSEVLSNVSELTSSKQSSSLQANLIQDTARRCSAPSSSADASALHPPSADASALHPPSPSALAVTAPVSLNAKTGRATRAEAALRRHQERMQRIKETRSHLPT